MLSLYAKTLIQSRVDMSSMEGLWVPLRKSQTHGVTHVTGTTQKNTIGFVGNLIPTNSKQKKCAVFAVEVILRMVFP